MNARIPLHELVPGMSDTDPQDGPALLRASTDDLSEAAHALRQHIVDAVKGSSRPTLSGPSAVREALKRKLLQPAPDRWTLYALGPDRKTVQIARPEGGTRNLTVPAFKVPEPAELPPLPRGGRWLVIWRGPVSVLEIEGVPHRLSKLQRIADIADVVFYDDTAEGDPTLYSLKLGRGARGTDRVEFPDPGPVALAQSGRMQDEH